ncbi:MAG: HNH endonuclease [bacterium]|nr:HNH endonuclease [bacterium]
MLTITDLPTRIASKIEVGEEHWLWTGWSNNAGYPYAHFEGRDQPAYRVVYLLLVGPIPDGYELDHTCVTPMCVWPAHLEPVTHAENQLRIRARFTACRRAGHDWSVPRNVAVRPNGSRYCAECARIDMRARYAAKKSLAAA